MHASCALLARLENKTSSYDAFIPIHGVSLLGLATILNLFSMSYSQWLLMSNQSGTFGTYLRLVNAQSTDRVILNAAQNGGAVTGLLTFALERKIIDGALVSALSKEKPMWPRPILAKSSQEIFESAGTRYTYSPNVQALSEMGEKDVKALGFVGTPCQIIAVRKMQQKGLNCAQRVKLLVGLMCSKTFSYEGLMVEHLQNELGVDLSKVRKTEVSAGKMKVTLDEEELGLPLVKIEKYARKSCEKCFDYSSELADISAGGLGLGKWTFLIARTPTGEQVLKEAELAEVLLTRAVQMNDPAVKLLIKLSKKKQERD